MDSILKRRSTRVLTAAAVLSLAVTAFAFWTTLGDGTGSAATDTAATDTVTINGNAVSGLAPGRTVALTGTIVNPNDYDVHVNQLSIDGISVNEPHLSAGCTVSNYSATTTPVTVNTTLQESNAGTTDQVTFPVGLTVTMLETGLNQNACKGATITVDYATN